MITDFDSTKEGRPNVRLATQADARSAATVLGQAFADDPLFIWLAPREDERLVLVRAWMALALTRSLLRGHVLVARSKQEDRTVGAALWTPPGLSALTDHERFTQLIVASVLVGRDLSSQLSLLAPVREMRPEGSFYYLRDIGVDEAERESGIARRLVGRVHESCDRDGYSAYLETTRREDIEIFQALGYHNIGSCTIADGLMFHGMLRSPIAPRSD
jgi:GNAT superfamily N-acetyltransferase